MANATLPSNDNQISSLNATAQDRQLLIVDLLTALAVAFGQIVTAERLQLNAADLDDVPLDYLERACQRARKELRFYPSVAEIRNLAVVDSKSKTELEAEQAWQWVMRDLAQRGRDARPGPDNRIEYAIRSAGGRLSINACFSAPLSTEQFTKKAFVEAFARYEAAVNLRLDQLLPPARQLVAGGTECRPQPKLPPGVEPSTSCALKAAAKPMPSPLSGEQLRARRALLTEEMQRLQASR